MTEAEQILISDEAVPKPKLAAALAAFQAEVPKVRKGSRAEIAGREGRQGYSYEYADLADLTDVVMPLLGKHGLAFTSKPTWLWTSPGANPVFVLIYKLMHTSGEQEVGIWPLPPPGSAGPQTLGSGITYARRYCLQAVTGVSPAGQDDDAAQAQDGPLPPEPDPGRIEPGQARRIVTRLTELGVADDKDTRMAWIAGITGFWREELDDLTRSEAAALLDELAPATRRDRNEVITALDRAGISEQSAVLAYLAEWTGRAITGTGDLCRYEAGMVQRRAREGQAEREEQDKAGEQQQTLDGGTP